VLVFVVVTVVGEVMPTAVEYVIWYPVRAVEALTVGAVQLNIIELFEAAVAVTTGAVEASAMVNVTVLEAAK
jgi:hypothetical protein